MAGFAASVERSMSRQYQECIVLSTVSNQKATLPGRSSYLGTVPSGTVPLGTVPIFLQACNIRRGLRKAHGTRYRRRRTWYQRLLAGVAFVLQSNIFYFTH